MSKSLVQTWPKFSAMTDVSKGSAPTPAPKSTLDPLPSFRVDNGMAPSAGSVGSIDNAGNTYKH